MIACTFILPGNPWNIEGWRLTPILELNQRRRKLKQEKGIQNIGDLISTKSGNNPTMIQLETMALGLAKGGEERLETVTSTPAKNLLQIQIAMVYPIDGLPRGKVGDKQRWLLQILVRRTRD